jgi:hypothetical protein
MTNSQINNLYGRKRFENFSQEEIEETLGCLVTWTYCNGVEDYYLRKCYEIDNWIKKYEKGECSEIPYTWRSEENYKEVLSWYESKCHKFKASKALPYNDFIIKHSAPKLKLEAQR